MTESDEMERFYRKSMAGEGKNVVGKGELYRVEDVLLSGGVLQTKSGTALTPLEMPTPSPTPMIAPTIPKIEPTPIPTTSP
jgi:hypothetical protein